MVENVSLLLRVLYQRAKVLAHLPALTPRALQDAELVAGRSEFVVVDSADLPGAGWEGTGLLLPRQYTGYIAVHYAAGTDQHETFPDEARLVAALATFPDDPRARSIPGLRQFGYVPSRWFLNDTPAGARLPPVQTLLIEWSLDVDLLIPPEFLTGDPTP